MKRILHVLPAFESGGVEYYVKDVLTRFASLHPEETFYVASFGGKLVETLPSNVNHINLPSKSKFAIYQNASALENICRMHGIKHLHAHSRSPAWSCALASKWLGISYSTTFHGVYSHENIFKRFYNKAMYGGDFVIAISDFIENHLKSVYSFDHEKILTVHEGIDTHFFDPENYTEEDRLALYNQYNIPFYHRLIVMPGRFSRIKGQKVALEAIQGIQNITLMLLGMPKKIDTYTKELLDYVKQNNLSVLFVDPSDDITRYYAAAHLILSLRTTPEAYGRVIAEALAMEKLLITTNHGGALELSKNGEYAVLVGSSDALQTRKAIEDALTMDQEQAFFMTRAARTFIRNTYQVDQMIGKLEKIFYSDS